jgi:hypothetical protein
LEEPTIGLKGLEVDVKRKKNEDERPKDVNPVSPIHPLASRTSVYGFHTSPHPVAQVQATIE